MSRTDDPVTQPNSHHLDSGVHPHKTIDIVTLERQRRLQNRSIHSSSDSSAGQSSTPLLKYGPLPGYRKTDPRRPVYASQARDKNPSSQSTFLHGFQDQLIQQQRELDQRQQWRIEHEPQGLGHFARLPSEIRRQIYLACFPSECIDFELGVIPQQRPQNGLISLMRLSRCIHDEVQPLMEQHTKTRFFNLALGEEGVQFERCQFSFSLLTHEGLQRMSRETIPSLDLFARTRKRIRNLRLAIQIDSSRPPPSGLRSTFESFAMLIFSLLANAAALQHLLVQFHLSHEFDTKKLAQDDGSDEIHISELIGVLLGHRAAERCHMVTRAALATSLEVARFVVMQRDRDQPQQEKLVTSFRWSRPTRNQRSVSQLVSKPQHTNQPQLQEQSTPQDWLGLPGAQHSLQDTSQKDFHKHLPKSVSAQPLRGVGTQVTPQSISQRVSQSLIQQPVYRSETHLPTPVLSHGGQNAHHAPTASSQTPSQSADTQPLASSTIPHPVAQAEVTQPVSQTTAIKQTDTSPTTIRTIPSSLKPRETSSANAQTLQHAPQFREEKKSPSSFHIEQNPPGVPFPSIDSLGKLSKSLETSASPFIDDTGPLPQDVHESRPHQSHMRELKRQRRREMKLESKKRRKLDLGDHTSTSQSVVPSSQLTQLTETPSVISKQLPGKKNQRLEKESIANAVPSEEEQYVVQSLRDVRIKNGVSQVRVKWYGYDQLTWEPRASLMEDVPDMLKAFDKRQKKAAALNLRAKTLQEHRKSPQDIGKAVGGLDQRPTEIIDTPNTATARMNQWKAQQDPQIPPQFSAHEGLNRVGGKMPNRPLTPYFLYMQANRPAIWADLCRVSGNPKLVTEARIAQDGKQRWLDLGKEERDTWERVHAKRVEIYHVQMDAFNAGRDIPNREDARVLIESREKETSSVHLN